eukprot:Ihof_evm5s407 gene=Ihof_evmTU5s407
MTRGRSANEQHDGFIVYTESIKRLKENAKTPVLKRRQHLEQLVHTATVQNEEPSPVRLDDRKQYNCIPDCVVYILNTQHTETVFDTSCNNDK